MLGKQHLLPQELNAKQERTVIYMGLIKKLLPGLVLIVLALVGASFDLLAFCSFGTAVAYSHTRQQQQVQCQQFSAAVSVHSDIL